LLRYFRINDPYRLAGLLVLLLIIYLPLFFDPPPVTKTELKSIMVGEKMHEGSKMYSEIVDNTAPLAAWFHALMDMLFDRSILARHIVAFVVIFFQSAFLGIIFINKKVFSENTYIPSLIFSILFFFSFDTLTLSDELIGSGFLLLALNNLFKEIEFRMQRDETTFNLGLYVSFASLFYFPYVIFLFGITLILFFFTRTNLRKFLLLIFGFLLPHLLVLAINYLNGSTHEIWSYYYASGLSFGVNNFMTTKSLLMLSAVPLFYLAVSVFMLNRLARFSKYQSQLLQSMFLWIGFGFIYLIFCRDLRTQTLIVLIPGFTFLFTHFLLLIRRRKFAEMNIWLLVIGVVAVSYMARYNKIGSIDYQPLIIPSEDVSKIADNVRVLALKDDITVYTQHRAATPFLNWKLSKDVFMHPEYYENITYVYHALKKDPPAIIMDPQNLMKPFFERMPMLKRQYTREGENYVRIR
jgi:hypothetical protein